MTTPMRRDNNQEPSKNDAAAEQPGFIYDDPNATEHETEYEYDPNYVPEREFVLMPLFRRIGQMLGLRHRREDQYVYTPEPVGSAAENSGVPEPGLPLQARVAEEHESAAAPAAMPLESEGRPETEDVLAIEPEFASEPMFAQHTAPELVPAIEQQQVEPITEEAQFEPEPVAMQEETEPQPVLSSMEEPIVPAVAPEIQEIQKPITPEVQPVVARAARPSSPARPVLTQEDIKELIAPIAEVTREAAAKISATVSQAAEWLHAKEEEILRRAEQTVATAMSSRSRTQTAEEAPNVSIWEPSETPGVQPELAQAMPAQRRPQLVRKPVRVPFWKRIDWSRELTPTRAAILGAVAMAALMYVGISLARRPASSVLPPQETRAIKPGGVTLTTHPSAAPAVRATQPQRRSPAVSSRPTARPVSNRAHRAPAYDDGPDVVTHYYGKPKPSPVHQSTIAGVRHYSDMQ